jgi:hypothetical protein
MDKERELNKFFSHLDVVLDCETEKIFPELLNPTIKETWLYLQKSPGFLGGFSKTNISRAINCFSNIFSDNYDWIFPKYFLWSVIGLESLYGKGGEPTLRQLVEKSKIFLDLPNNTEKIVKKMYNFRSRVFHGQVDIPNGTIMNHPKNIARSDYSDEEYESTVTATYLLVLSLQKCVLNRIQELDFDYVVRTK